VADPAIILTDRAYRSTNAKVAHGLVRGGNRFQVVAVVDADSAGQDAGVLLDGKHRGIPIVTSLSQVLHSYATLPRYCVVGVATHGGHFTASLRTELVEAANAGLSIVNGLHDLASADTQIADAAARHGASIIDLRKLKPRRELHFWSGAIAKVRTPRLAVMGMDCAIGKRTTARLLIDALTTSGLKAEMIYTGQTGWMQGGRYGFVLDSVINDYVSGELEHAVVTCEREVAPDLMIIEGQSSLRNPSGPCGAEFLVSAQARGVIMQHAPAREFYEGYEHLEFRIPPIEDELTLLHYYGARALAVTLNEHGMNADALARYQQKLTCRLEIPVMRPLVEGMGELVPVVQQFIANETT